jgi:hypothetical protein
MLEASSIGGRTLVWKLPAGVAGKSVDLGGTKGWSIQIDGDFGGGAVVLEASNNGARFYTVDTFVAPGLYTPEDDFCWYRIEFKDAAENAAIEATIYTY